MAKNGVQFGRATNPHRATFFYDRSVVCMGLLDRRLGRVQAKDVAGVCYRRRDVRSDFLRALSMFDTWTSCFSRTRTCTRPQPVYESLNRSDVEEGYVNETGWFNLNDHRAASSYST